MRTIAREPAIDAPLPMTWKQPHFIKSITGKVVETTLFMHGLKTKSGRKRLVIIKIVQPRTGHGQHLSTLMFDAGTLSNSPRHHGPDMGLELDTLPSLPLRFYAGQEDPGDEAHFTIDFDTPAGRHTVHGWLQDASTPSWDPVKVTMEARPAATN